MNYRKIVASNQVAFTKVGMLKLVRDLAMLLEMKEFSVGKKETWDHGTAELADVREGAFNKFCAACLAVSIELPGLEESFYEAPLFKVGARKLDEPVKKEQDRVREQVSQQLNGKRSKNARLCRSLQSVMDVFPQPGYGRFDEKKMLSMMNKLIVGEGGLPIRPDYSEIKINTQQMKAPAVNAKLLIVDDDKKVALKTATAIAGWPGVNIHFHFYKGGNSWNELKGDALEIALTKAAQDVLKKSAHIILMDQGLGDIKGSDLVKKIKSVTDTPPLFVGNTGGSDDELRSAGAFQNCDKGSKLSGLSQAMELLK